MLGQEVKFPFLKRPNTIPYWFIADEVTRIFDRIDNIKYLAMFNFDKFNIIGGKYNTGKSTIIDALKLI